MGRVYALRAYAGRVYARRSFLCRILERDLARRSSRFRVQPSDVMSSKHIGADVNLAFPDAEIAVMGPAGAVNIMHRQEIADAADPEAKRAELTAAYKEQFANPFRAAELGFVDEVIRPRELRKRLVECLRRLRNKKDEGPKRKHGNIPL